MDRFIKIVVRCLVALVNIGVRLDRALFAAAWEICPGPMNWVRNQIDAAHKAVCEEQRSAMESRRDDRPAPKKRMPAVKAISELPSSFPSYTAQLETAKELRSQWDAARAARLACKYGTPEYKTADEKAEALWQKLDKVYRVPVTLSEDERVVTAGDRY